MWRVNLSGVKCDQDNVASQRANMEPEEPTFGRRWVEFEFS